MLMTVLMMLNEVSVWFVSSVWWTVVCEDFMFVPGPGSVSHGPVSLSLDLFKTKGNTADGTNVNHTNRGLL